jgi:guanylate kinase
MGIKVVTIFLRVPKDELQRRLENRIDKLSHEEIMLRLNRFDYEESKMDNYDYVMKNDNLEKALSIIERIIEQEYKEERETK